MRLIDADETIREIVWNSLSESGEAIEATAKAIRCIENMPSIDAVKHGRWEEKEVIHYGQTIEEWQSAKCSVCGRYHTTPFTYYFKYCPNCGARMDEGDNHETN